MPRKIRLARMRILLCVPILGCINTDFGRVRPSLRTDDMHSWMGPAITERYGEPASQFRLTDEERSLRDLAYPLIEPPYERQRWYSVLNEYGITRIFQRDWWLYDETAYTTAMFGNPARSTETYYNRLIEDIRNDIVRIGPFAANARYISDMDLKREKSLRYVSNLSPSESGNTLARIAENSLIARWVNQSLMQRVTSYQFALERLVISAPSPMAAEAERQLQLMRIAIAEAALVPRGAPPVALITK